MEDKLCGELLAVIDGKIATETMAEIKKAYCKILAHYEISEKSNQLIVFEDIPQAVKTYLVTRKIEGLSKGSIELYAMTLRMFFEAVKKPVETISANDIRVYLYTYQEKRKVSDRTLNTVRCILASFFKWANAEGYAPTNPALLIKKIKYEKKERKSLSEKELESVRSCATNIRDQAMLEFFYSTGCRVSEVSNIDISSVDFDKGEVLVLGKGNKERKVYLNAKTQLLLKKYLSSRDDESDKLFVTMRKPYKGLTKSAIELIFAQLGESAGLDRKLYPHLIRHTTATLALERGMDVTEIQKMLGHASVSTTMIYAKTNDSAVKELHKKCII